MVRSAGPIDKQDAVEVAQYLAPKLAAPVGFDVWTREESGLLRTDRDVCTHCDDVLELARQLASLHPALSVTSYDLEKHASRAEEAAITLPPTMVVRGSGRSIRVVGLFAGLLFPALLDLVWFVSQGQTPLEEGAAHRPRRATRSRDRGDARTLRPVLGTHGTPARRVRG